MSNAEVVASSVLLSEVVELPHAANEKEGGKSFKILHVKILSVNWFVEMY